MRGNVLTSRATDKNMTKTPLDPLNHSLHDAWVEAIEIGPRLEISLHLALGSARISDPILPENGVLRLGAVRNHDAVKERLDLGPEPICRIDQVVYEAHSDGVRHCVRLELDPQGEVEVHCNKLSLTSST